MRSIQIAGREFGMLTPAWPVGKTPRGMLVWLCICRCGKLTLVRYGNLQSGHTTSCGCQKKGNGGWKRHGHSAPSTGGRTPEYYSYASARQRCKNPNNHKYAIYGGRGIEFRFKSFEEFYTHLGPRPAGTTLDRENTNGHYEPGNVRWATAKIQNYNRRKKAA